MSKNEKFDVAEIAFEMYKEYCMSKRKKPELEPESYAEFWLRDVIQNPTDAVLDSIFQLFIDYLSGKKTKEIDLE